MVSLCPQGWTIQDDISWFWKWVFTYLFTTVEYSSKNHWFKNSYGSAKQLHPLQSTENLWFWSNSLKIPLPCVFPYPNRPWYVKKSFWLFSTPSTTVWCCFLATSLWPRKWRLKKCRLTIFLKLSQVLLQQTICLAKHFYVSDGRHIEICFYDGD